LAKIEFFVSRVAVKAREMGAKISAKSGRRKILCDRSPAQMVQALKNSDLHPCFGQIGRYDRSVMASSNNYRIVHFVSHFITSSLVLLMLVENAFNELLFR
jgi:hypothetical protein